MSLASFTFGSLGDIITLISIANSIRKLLDESNGAPQECRDLVEYLRTFTETLKVVETLAVTPVATCTRLNSTASQKLQSQLLICHTLLKDFENKLVPYEDTLLSHDAAKTERRKPVLKMKSRMHRWFYKLRWSSVRSDARLLRERLQHEMQHIQVVIAAVQMSQLSSVTVHRGPAAGVYLVDFTDHETVVPTEFCANAASFQSYLEFYFRATGRKGMGFVKWKEYHLISADTGMPIGPDSWKEFLGPGMKITMSAILWCKAKSDPQICPSCKAENHVGDIAPDYEVQCRACNTLFRVFRKDNGDTLPAAMDEMLLGTTGAMPSLGTWARLSLEAIPDLSPTPFIGPSKASSIGTLDTDSVRQQDRDPDIPYIRRLSSVYAPPPDPTLNTYLTDLLSTNTLSSMVDYGTSESLRFYMERLFKWDSNTPLQPGTGYVFVTCRDHGVVTHATSSAEPTQQFEKSSAQSDSKISTKQEHTIIAATYDSDWVPCPLCGKAVRVRPNTPRGDDGKIYCGYCTIAHKRSQRLTRRNPEAVSATSSTAEPAQLESSSSLQKDPSTEGHTIIAATYKERKICPLCGVSIRRGVAAGLNGELWCRSCASRYGDDYRKQALMREQADVEVRPAAEHTIIAATYENGEMCPVCCMPLWDGEGVPAGPDNTELWCHSCAYSCSYKYRADTLKRANRSMCPGTEVDASPPVIVST